MRVMARIRSCENAHYQPATAIPLACAAAAACRRQTTTNITHPYPPAEPALNAALALVTLNVDRCRSGLATSCGHVPTAGAGVPGSVFTPGPVAHALANSGKEHTRATKSGKRAS